MLDPPRGSTAATRADKILSLRRSATNASKPHKQKSAAKPEKKAGIGRCGINALTAKAATAIVHQGKKRPTTKLSKAINAVVTTNFTTIYRLY
jgi:hypothetical protein